LGHQNLRTGAKRADESALVSHKQFKKQRRSHRGNDLAKHVFLSDMRNFVRDGAGQFLRAVHKFQQASGYNDVPAGHRKCIGNWHFHDMKPKLDLIRWQ
jgi:hypothetical protein